MDNIQVEILQDPGKWPVGISGMLAKLTQRGHKISNAAELKRLYHDSVESYRLVENVIDMGHMSVMRHSLITLAIVGGSRRLLPQIRTHNIGIDWVSASMQYSDYSDDGDFVMPYEILNADEETQKIYKEKCKKDLYFYRELVRKGFDNDTAGYTMNHALRNVIVVSANPEAWLNLLNKRLCRRNTDETMYVAALIWEQLLDTKDGFTIFKHAGPSCTKPQRCLEGKLCCGDPVQTDIYDYVNPAKEFIERNFPILSRG